LEKQEYEGLVPPRDTYDPDGMSAKKKAEFERWYQEKVQANYHFVMQREREGGLLVIRREIVEIRISEVPPRIPTESRL